MKPIHVLSTVLALAVLLLGPPARPVEAASTPLLAIFNLRPLNIEAIGYDGEILYSLITDLEGKHSLRTMPRREMEERLYEEGLSQSDTSSRVLAAGQKLGLDYVVFGNVSKTGGQVKAKISLLGVRQRQVLGTWSPTFSSNKEIAKATKQLADQIEILTMGVGAASALVESSAPLPQKVGVKDFKAKNQGSAVLLSWTFNSRDPIKSFSIYRAGSTKGPFRYLGQTSSNSFTDTKAQRGASYYYQIGIVLKDGNEVRPKELAQIKSAGEKVPHPPLILEAKGQVQRAKLSCVPSLQNVKDKFTIKSYILYRRNSDQPQWQEIARIPADQKKSSSLSFELTDASAPLPDGAQFEYAVSSLDKKGKESALSDPVQVTVTVTPKLTLGKDNMLRRVDLQWVGIPEIDGYYLYRRHSAGTKWERIAKIRPDESTYTDATDLADGQTYIYRLSAYDKEGETSPSAEVAAKTKPVPAAPAGLLAKGGQVKAVTLHWEPLTDADVGGYVVYRGLDNKKMEDIGRVKGRDNVAYTDKGTLFEPLKDGTTYYYTVVGYNLFKAEGKPSTFAVATTKPRPKAVQAFKAALTSGGIRLTWKQSPEKDIASYEIYREGFGGFVNKLAAMQPAQTAFVDSDVSPGSSYAYRIVAVDKDGLESDKVDSNSVTIPK
ncbi:MAG: hypothetical protein ACNI3A_01365 [Desulfovibrio sp.]|uniref:hypothetical protein n=1 Tax=Desulfovibrio sp. 7SRBS1 TaxID=3378064 RepID=UPI003B3E1776